MNRRCRHLSWTAIALAASATLVGCATTESSPPWQVPSYGSTAPGSSSPYYRGSPYGYGYGPGYGYPDPYYGYGYRQAVPYPAYGTYPYAYPPGNYCRDNDRDGRCDQAEKKQRHDDDRDRDDDRDDRQDDGRFGKRPFKDLGRLDSD